MAGWEGVRQPPNSSQAASPGTERPLEGRKRKPTPGVHGYPSTCTSHVHVIPLAVKGVHITEVWQSPQARTEHGPQFPFINENHKSPMSVPHGLNEALSRGAAGVLVLGILVYRLFPSGSSGALSYLGHELGPLLDEPHRLLHGWLCWWDQTKGKKRQGNVLSAWGKAALCSLCLAVEKHISGFRQSLLIGETGLLLKLDSGKLCKPRREEDAHPQMRSPRVVLVNRTAGMRCAFRFQWWSAFESTRPGSRSSFSVTHRLSPKLWLTIFPLWLLSFLYRNKFIFWGRWMCGGV